MQTPNFSQYQFVDENGLNTAFGSVSGSIAALAAETFPVVGLLYPEMLTYSGSGMVLTVGAPSPAAIVTISGTVALAHGTTTGSDTQTYSVNFASLVPASGSVTAYLVATAATVQQNPIGIPGPPQGHPSYNPNFVPGVGYQSTTDTFSLTATTSYPNNNTAFEVARTTLTAGQATLPTSSLDFSHQKRATGYLYQQPVGVTGSYALPIAYAAAGFFAATPGYTNTLPPANSSAGIPLSLFNASTGVWTITASGSDQIYGLSGSAGLTSCQMPAQSALRLWCEGSAWRVVAASPNAANPHGFLTQSTPGAFNWTCPPGVYSVKARVWGPGGGGGYGASNNWGGGGGGGAYFEGRVPVTPGTTYNHTLGTPGTGGTSVASGTSGTTTTLVFDGGNAVCNGGTGSANNGGAQGSGGTATVTGLSAGAYTALAGNPGNAGLGLNLGGMGGGTFGGMAQGYADGAGNGGTMPGVGGGGGGGQSGGNGAAGSDGCIILEW